MTTLHHITEADLRRRALDFACPTCGAEAKVRCRFVSKTTTGSTKVDVRRRPCDERVTLAWRATLREAGKQQ